MILKENGVQLDFINPFLRFTQRKRVILQSERKIICKEDIKSLPFVVVQSSRKSSWKFKKTDTGRLYCHQCRTFRSFR